MDKGTEIEREREGRTQGEREKGWEGDRGTKGGGGGARIKEGEKGRGVVGGRDNAFKQDLWIYAIANARSARSLWLGRI